MTPLSRLGALAVPAGYAAAALAAAALVLFLLVVGDGSISDAGTSAAFYLPTTAQLGSTIALLLALVALHVGQAASLGAIGLVGFLVALLGTALAAGAGWTYVFVVPYLSRKAPSLADESSGSVLAGFVLSYLLLGLGWLLVGVAWHRSRHVSRWVSALVMLGAVVAILPMPSRTLVLTVAVAQLGRAASRRTADAPA